MRTTKRSKFFGIVFALAVALMLGGIALVANCFAVQKSETQVVYADSVLGTDYYFYYVGTIWSLDLNNDCSIDMKNLFNKKGLVTTSYLDICLNGHTLTVLNSGVPKVERLYISDGTIIFNNNGSGVLFENSGVLELNNVTFKANCESLFVVDYYDDANVSNNIKVKNCKFIDCKFTGDWGSAFSFDTYIQVPMTFENNYFYNCECTGPFSSLIYINDLGYNTRSATNHVRFNMSGNKFYGCKNTRGCITINAPYIDIGTLNEGAILNSIDRCESSSYAGAIFDGDYGGYGLIKGFVCTNNISKGCYGGAIYLAADSRTIDDCTFVGNSATENGYGGAIYFEEDYLTVQNSYFTENYAYKGGAIYNKGWTNALTSCLFAYNTAKYGWANDVRLPTHATNCHFYNTSKDGVFDTYWTSYYGYDGYVESSCTVQNNGNFLGIAGAGTTENPFKIDSESAVFKLYVGIGLGLNSTLASYKYIITKDNLIWFSSITDFRGIIDGCNMNIFIQGNDTAIASGGDVKYYIAENHNGITRHETPSSVSYYVFNETSKNFESRTSDVDYMTNYAVGPGIYYINHDVTFSERVKISGNVTLIFNSGVTLTAEKGIHLPQGKTLTLATVTTDKNQAGKLVAKGFDGNAGIGGNYGRDEIAGIDYYNDVHGGDFYDYGVKLEITSEATGIGGGVAGVPTDKHDGYNGGNGGNVKIFGAIATITSNGTGIGGGQGNSGKTHNPDAPSINGGNGGSGGTLSLINTDLTINSTSSIGIGGSRGWWNSRVSSKFWGGDGRGTELYIYNGTTKVKSGYGKAICAYKDAQHYGEQQFDFIDENPLLIARYGTDENNTNEWGSYKIKDYASANYVEIAEHSHNCTYVANGNTITATCGICGTTASISASISNSGFNGLPKQVSISNLDNFLAFTKLTNVNVVYYKDVENFYQSQVFLGSTPPTAVGNYTVVVSVSDDIKVSLNFEIIKGNIADFQEITASLSTQTGAQTVVTLPNIPDDFVFGAIINNNTNLYTVSEVTNKKITLTAQADMVFSGPETSFTILVNNESGFYNDKKITVKVTPSGHTHRLWLYNVNGDTITATCGGDGCSEPSYSVSLTLSANGGTYNGTPFTATHNDDITKFSTITKAPLGKIEYYKGTQKLNSAPKDAGTYTAKLTINGTYTIQKEFVVQKATAEINVDTTTITKTYDGTGVQLPTATSNYGTVVCDKTSNDLVNVGTYTVTYTLAETGNYTGDTKTLTVIIEPKEVGLTWSTLTDKDLVYDGTPKVLTATATGLVGEDKCDVNVALASGDNTNINAGKFTYKATGLSNDNYKLPTNVTSPEYTITKSNADNYAKEIDVLLSLYSGETAEVTLPEIPNGLSFGATTNNNTDLYSVSAINNGKITITVLVNAMSAIETYITILVNGNENYNDYTITVNVIPSDHTHGNWSYEVNSDTITATCGKDGCSSTKYSVSLTLSTTGGTYDGETTFIASHNNTLTMFTIITGATLGEIEYYKGDQKLNSAPKDAGTYTAKLTINGTDTIQKEFVVAKATYDMSNAKWDYTKAFTYDKTGKTVLVTGLPDGVSVEYSNNAKTDVGEYTASAALDYDTDNYNEISIADLNWKINKAQVELPTAIDGLVYSGTEQTGVVLPNNALFTLSGNKETNVGDYIATATLNDKNNYEWKLEVPTSTDQEIAWSIDKASLIITAESETIAFNEDASTYTVNVNGFVNSEDFNTYNVDIANYLSCEYEKGKDVGSYDIVLADDESKTLATALKNYALTLVKGTLTVEQKSITGATVVYDESKVYNGDYQTFNVQSVTIDNLEVTFAVENNTKKDYSENGYTLTIIASGNFTGTITKPFAITKAKVTVTIADKTSVYGDNIVALTSEITSGTLYGEDNLNITLTKETGIDAGTYAITGNYNNTNYDVTFVNGTYTISPKEVKVSGITAQNKTYDGTNAAILNYDYVVLTGKIDGDKLTVLTTGTFADENVGENKTVTFGTLVLDGEDAANYVLAQTDNQVTTKANITAKALTNDAIETISAQTYTGSAITPSIVVKDGEKILTENTDYTVTYANNTNVGTATVTVTLQGNYSGTISTTFTITAKASTNDAIETISTQTYTGSAITPKVVVKDGEKILTENTDYTVAYSNNTNVGTATVTVTLKGNYSGTISKTFTISKATPTYTAPTAKTGLIYSGADQELITEGSSEDGTFTYSLTEDSDYASAIPTGKNAGNYTVYWKLTGDANHSDASGSVAVIISAKTITLTIVDVATGTYTHDGQAKTTTVAFTGLVGDDELTYTLSYSDNINAGTCEVLIASASITKGIATNYNLITTDTGTLVIDKSAQSITNISDISKTYDGTAVSAPTYTKLGDGAVTIKYKVKNAEEYLIEAPTNVGNYVVEIIVAEGTNYLAGSQTAEFAINQKAENVKVKGADGNEIQNPPASIIGAENGLPPDAVFVVSTISSEDTEKITEVKNVLKDMLDNQKVLAVYDAKIMVDNIEKQPNGNITIKMQVPTELLGKNFVIFHIHSTDDIQAIDNLQVDENGFITITIDRLSQFAFAVQNDATNNTMMIIIIAGAVVVLGAVITTIICISKRKAKLGK